LCDYRQRLYLQGDIQLIPRAGRELNKPTPHEPVRRNIKKINRHKSLSKTYMTLSQQLHKVQVICRETGGEWTIVDNSLWNSPVEAIASDFTVTELKYECAQMLVTPPAPAAVESAFDVLMY
jgi:uncharacterized lipoprotein YmbA